MKGAVAKLSEKLGDPDPTVRLQAIIALGRIGDPAPISRLVPILADADRYLAFSARQALRRIGDWKATSAGLASKDPRIRAGVLATLELVYDLSAVAAIRSVATSEAATVDDRVRALTALTTVHRKAPPWNGKWWGTRPTKGGPPAKTLSLIHISEPTRPIG